MLVLLCKIDSCKIDSETWHWQFLLTSLLDTLEHLSHGQHNSGSPGTYQQWAPWLEFASRFDVRECPVAGSRTVINCEKLNVYTLSGQTKCIELTREKLCIT